MTEGAHPTPPVRPADQDRVRSGSEPADTARGTGVASAGELVSAARTTARPRVGVRVRWAIAALATALVTAGLGALFSIPGSDVAPGTAPAVRRPSALAYVPADSLAYVELQVQPSATQREQLAALFSMFPGFADCVAFEFYLDRLYDRA